MRSHSVTCHPAEVTSPLLSQPQPKLVRDLATPEGCEAELTDTERSISDRQLRWMRQAPTFNELLYTHTH